jgi:hypothetical protein
MSEWILVVWAVVASVQDGGPRETTQIKHVLAFDSKDRCSASVDAVLHVESTHNVGSGVYGNCYRTPPLMTSPRTAAK